MIDIIILSIKPYNLNNEYLYAVYACDIVVNLIVIIMFIKSNPLGYVNGAMTTAATGLYFLLTSISGLLILYPTYHSCNRYIEGILVKRNPPPCFKFLYQTDGAKYLVALLIFGTDCIIFLFLFFRSIYHIYHHGWRWTVPYGEEEDEDEAKILLVR